MPASWCKCDPLACDYLHAYVNSAVAESDSDVEVENRSFSADQANCSAARAYSCDTHSCCGSFCERCDERWFEQRPLGSLHRELGQGIRCYCYCSATIARSSVPDRLNS